MTSNTPLTSTELLANPTVHDIVEAYAHVHQLPYASYIYVWILWLTLAGIFIIVAIFHQMGGRVSYLGSLLNKWLLRRRTWRKKHSLRKAMKAGKKHSQPYSLPSNAQLLCITALWIFTIALLFIGPDYIVFDSASTFTKPFISARDTASSNLQGNIFHQTIQKSWWTSSARQGAIALSLFPFCVLLVTKAPPFAILAIPFFVQIWNDKLVFLHKWTGRLIYFITAVHVVTWSVQLAQDTVSDTDHKSVWSVVFLHIPFIDAWIAFGLFTVLMVLSFKTIRHKYFEFFYFSHVLLVPLILIFAALHFPRLQWWSWATLIGWGSERIYRFAKLLWVNGIISNLRTAPMTRRYIDFVNNERAGLAISNMKDGPFQAVEKSNDEKKGKSKEDAPARRRPGYSYRGTYVPPPGYAHIVLLPGKTVRLRLVVPRSFSWAPGQHVLLTVPAVNRFQSHPFTISSACSDGLPGVDTQDVVLVIRAQNGFTKALYEHVEKLQNENSRGDTPDFAYIPPNDGVLLRAYIGGPFGSSVRVNWTTHSTIVIIAGGSGCSYAASILEHLTSCVAGKRDLTLSGRESAGQIKRIRFIWIVREFAYLQWIASMVCRAMERVPEGTLQVDIYVTNTMSKKAGRPLALPPYSVDDLHPGVASRLPRGSVETIPAYDLEQQDTDLDEIIETYEDLEHEQHVLDMTNFGGEDDTMMPAERELSRQLQAEGEIRRAETNYRKSMMPSVRFTMPAFSGSHFVEPSFNTAQTPILPTLPEEEAVILAEPRPAPPTNSSFVSDNREADDMFVLSEMAHSGRAKMNEIIAEEAAQCAGTNMLVCCCGPTALIASIRKHVAENIKPDLVADGKAPAITLASEEFEN